MGLGEVHGGWWLCWGWGDVGALVLPVGAGKTCRQHLNIFSWAVKCRARSWTSTIPVDLFQLRLFHDSVVCERNDKLMSLFKSSLLLWR